MSGTITLIAQTLETTGSHDAPSRPASEQDAAELAELFFASYDTDAVSSPEMAREIIDGVFAGRFGPFLPEASTVVEDEDGHVIAAALVLAQREGDDLPRVPYLFELFTAAAHRRRGLAEQLVREAMTKLYHAGYEQLSLRIAEDNSAALALYLTLDFHRWVPDHDDV